MWASLKALSLGWKAVAVGLLALAIVLWINSCTATTNHNADVAIDAAEGKGAATVRAEAAEEGIRDVVKSQEVRQVIDRDAVARFDLCLRTSRTPENCQRPGT